MLRQIHAFPFKRFRIFERQIHMSPEEIDDRERQKVSHLRKGVQHVIRLV